MIKNLLLSIFASASIFGAQVEPDWHNFNDAIIESRYDDVATALHGAFERDRLDAKFSFLKVGNFSLAVHGAQYLESSLGSPNITRLLIHYGAHQSVTKVNLRALQAIVQRN